MRWRRPAFCLIGVAVVGAMLFVAACLCLSSQQGRTVAQRVQPGMSRVAAQTAVGRPPDHSWVQSADGVHLFQTDLWRHGEGDIIVMADESGVVVHSSFNPDKPSLFDRVKKLLGL